MRCTLASVSHLDSSVKTSWKDLYSDSSYKHASRNSRSLLRATRRFIFFDQLQAFSDLRILPIETLTLNLS